MPASQNAIYPSAVQVETWDFGTTLNARVGVFKGGPNGSHLGQLTIMPNGANVECRCDVYYYKAGTGLTKRIGAFYLEATVADGVDPAGDVIDVLPLINRLSGIKLMQNDEVQLSTSASLVNGYVALGDGGSY